MKRPGDNDKLVGVAFDLTCGCTIRVKDIFADLDIHHPESSRIMVELELTKHCETAHRSEVVGNFYFQEYSRFHREIHPSYGKIPVVNTIESMKGRKKDECI